MGKQNYTLEKLENKNGSFTYRVINPEDGSIISQRKSRREYVACTIDGSYYFGRRDLIGKGEHGQHLKRLRDGMNNQQESESYRSYCKNKIEELNKIAYLSK